jgi:LuxR family maltose regulon positive regulatory protein
LDAPFPLLSTKLFVPPPRPTLVARPRLLERLSQGLTLPLTLISAPAGFGKTTLVSEWRASNAGRDYPLACLSLETDDNDPTRFLTYFVAALGTLKPDLAETALGMLQSPQPPPVQAFLTGLINELGELDHSFALVLDDYHVISAKPVHEALSFLVDHLPQNMHLVLLTRADPPLPLARMRVRDQLVEIRVDDLRFTSTESAAFFNQVIGLMRMYRLWRSAPRAGLPGCNWPLWRCTRRARCREPKTLPGSSLPSPAAIITLQITW